MYSGGTRDSRRGTRGDRSYCCYSTTSPLIVADEFIYTHIYIDIDIDR